MFAQCVHDFNTHKGLIYSLFLAGLFGGATHCSGMCGPFVMAQIPDTKNEGKPFLNRIVGAALIPYHLGRTTTYVFLALVLSIMLNLAFLFSPSRSLLAAPLLAMAGVMFAVSAFPKLAIVFPWASSVRIGLPYRWISRLHRYLSIESTILKRYALGVLLGFMPCGLVVSAIMASASAQTYLGTFLAMLAFSFGTFPALFMVGLGGSAIKEKFPDLWPKLSRGFMAASALWIFVLAGHMFFK